MNKMKKGVEIAICFVAVYFFLHGRRRISFMELLCCLLAAHVFLRGILGETYDIVDWLLRVAENAKPDEQ